VCRSGPLPARYVPLGYDVRDRKLIINEGEAATVRMIFKRFVAIGSATKLAKALVAEGVRSKSGRPIDKGYIYRLLNSQVYLGEATHKGVSYPGEHAAIIERSLWDKVHAISQGSPRLRGNNTRAQTAALLKETVSDRFIGRTIRLAYLAPSVLEALVIARRPPAISIKDLMIVAELPWGEQMRRVFEQAEHRE
jgi:hypothetical protein